MELHKRHIPMEEAQRELANFVGEWCEKHELTLAEQLLLLSGEMQRTLRLTVRSERERKKKSKKAHESEK